MSVLAIVGFILAVLNPVIGGVLVAIWSGAPTRTPASRLSCWR